MAITSGFFDSDNGDRLYTAEQMTEYFDGLVTDGVYESVGDRFTVTPGESGMTVTVGSGRAIIRSHWIRNSGAAVLSLEPADVQYNRIDYIVLRLDRTARMCELAVKRGNTASGEPAFSEPTRTDTVYELYIAAVRINRGATAPTRITDLRPSQWCGWVTGAVKQVETADLFTQWEAAYARQYAEFDAYMQEKEAAFNAWFASLTHDLTVQAELKEYRNSVQITEQTIGCDIGIPEYDPETDVLYAFVNGKHLQIDEDFSVVISGDAKLFALIGGWLYPGDDVAFSVLKNVVGGGAAPSGQIVIRLSGAAGGIGGQAVVTETEEENGS